MKPLPKNFLWGSATSAHQVEGHNHNDWSEWEKLGRVKNGDHSGQASGHYQRFREDFGLAKKLGQNAHRLSIEWSRIYPRPGYLDQDALDHYRQVLEELHRLHIEPIVTLHHFTNPLWISQAGGWTKRETIDAFGQYVVTVVQALGHLVKYWITINEPTVYTSLAYVSAVWPPEQKNYWFAWQAIRNFVLAHNLAYSIIHRYSPGAKVGAANNLSDFVPARSGHLLDRGLTAFARYWHNQWWLDQTYLSQDFIGLNYYFHHPLKFRLAGVSSLFAPFPSDDKPMSDMGWAIYPSGLGRVLDWLDRYHRPILITENGVADRQDVHRAAFIRDHVAQVRAAVDRGIDVRGYFYWSLLDNFEWREGFTPRFGLVEVNYQTLVRTIRPSAYIYQQICQKNGLE